MKHGQTIGLVALLLVAVVAPTGVATASHGHTGDTTGVLDRVAWTVSEATSDASSVAKTVLSGIFGTETTTNNSDVVQHANNLQSEYNQNNTTIESYVNHRVDTESTADSWNVVAVKMTLDGESSTRYIVANTTGTGNFTESEMVNNTSRTVDKRVSLSGYAVVQADDEIHRFVVDFAEPNKDITKSYRRELMVKYMGDVTLPAGVNP